MKVKHSHPKGLYMLFFAEMWERFSYYGMRALLVFYMTKHFLFSDKDAMLIYGSYTSLVYATPVFGGLIADRLLGYRKAVILGGVLMALGHFVMAFDQEQIFYFALGLLIIGNGFFKPNISTIVGKLYPEGDPRRDSGFTIFYMGINLGAFLSPLACGYIGETFGWHYGFGLAGFGMVAGLIQFIVGQKYLEGHAEPAEPEKLRENFILGVTKENSVYFGSAIAVLTAWQLVQRSVMVGNILTTVGIVVVIAIVVYMFAKCGPVERHRLAVAMVLIFFSMAFWAFFEQAGSSLNLFADRHVNRVVAGAEIKASVFQSVNALFILALGIPFAQLWIRLAERNREPNTPVKFGLGLVQLGLGFACLFYGASTSDQGSVALIWLILGYLLHTTGELCLSPVGLSMITKLSPHNIVGLMMGCWFLSTAFAQYIAGIIASLTGTSEGGTAGETISKAEAVMVYGNIFGQIALTAVAIGVIVLVLSPLLRRGMHGVH